MSVFIATKKTTKKVKGPKGEERVIARKAYYVVVVEKDPTNGKWKRHWIPVEGGEREAKRRKAEEMHRQNTGTFAAPRKVTVAAYLERWLADYAKPNLAPRTAEGYEFIIRRHIIPALGSVKLDQLTPGHIQHYLGQKRSEGSRLDGKGSLSPRTIRSHYMILHKALGNAVMLGHIHSNPTDKVPVPKCERSEMHTLDEFTLDRFLDCARGSQYYPLFYLLLNTAMRRSEALALRWQDVDLALGRVHVTRALHHLRDGSIIFRDCKTQKSRRTIYLPPACTLALADYRRRQERLYADIGEELKDHHLVFCRLDVPWTSEGPRSLLPNTVTHNWIKIARKAGLENIRLHDARHSHASLLMNNGVSLKEIAERLGHSTITTTADIYGHLSEAAQKSVADRFGEIMSRRGSGNGSAVPTD